MLKASFRVLTDIKKIVDTENKRILSAASTALKREGFLLAGQMKREIKMGAPGGQAYPRLSSIAGLQRKLRKPYTGLKGKGGYLGSLPGGMIPIRYNSVIDGTRMAVEVGMVDTRQEKISKNWKYIFAAQQQGFQGALRTITKNERRLLARVGAGLSKSSPFRKHFFLKKGTTEYRNLPARPIIDPFFSKWRVLSSQRIESNFHKKMMGERI